MKGKANIDFAAPVVGVLMLIPAIILFVTMIRTSFVVDISQDSIIIRGLLTRTIVPRTSIKTIDLLSMQNLYLSAGVTTTCTSIELDNGARITIADPLYRNAIELKNYLISSYNEKIKAGDYKKELYHTSSNKTGHQEFVGNRYFNFNSIIFYTLTLFFLVMMFRKPLSYKSFAFLIPIPIFYIGLGYQLNYFLVSNLNIIVKNIFLPWIKKYYAIDEVIATNKEMPNGRSEALRITTKDFHSKLYSAGSLRSKDWAQLEEKLKSVGISFLK